MASVYDRLIEPMQAGVRRIALEVAPSEAGWEVLDVGCGTGTGLALYRAAGCAVVGTDVSAAMLAKAWELLGEDAELHHVDPGPLPFADARFDLVIASMVLHEVPEEAREPLVREMVRVLKPGRRLLLIDFRFGSLRGWRGRIVRVVLPVIERLAGHYRHYRTFQAAGGLPALVEQAGGVVEREKIVAGGNQAIVIVA